MVSTQNEGRLASIDIALLSSGRSWKVKPSQPGPWDLKSSTRPEICEHVFTPNQRVRAGLDEGNRRFITY